MSTIKVFPVFMAALVLVSIGCGKKADEDSNADLNATETAVESSVSMISGVADDQAGTAIASMQRKATPSFMELIYPTSAVASSCLRAVNDTCVSGAKSVNYNGCNVGSSSSTMSGTVSLAFSDSACSMSTTGNYVSRTYDFQVIGPRSGTYSISSTSAADYRGTSYGGGGKLTKTASGWDIQILGRHSRFDRKGVNKMNISTRTLSNIQITGGLNRGARVVTGGQIEVNHNLAGFTAVFTPSNLQYSASCCHPVNGSMSVAYSGSKSGTATVTFNGCGSAELSEGGQTSSLAFNLCE